jgi:signal transduction histidine kinase
VNLIQWSVYSLLRIGGAYEGSPLAYLVSFLSLATALGLGLAALWPRDAAQEGSAAQARAVLPVTLPFLPALGALVYAGIGLALGRSFDAVSAWTALGVALLLCTRLYLALRQLQELSASLEARVQARTKDLEEAQATLLRTQHLSTVAAVAAGIAHDFKNLAGAIQGFADLALRDLDEKGAPLRSDLATIREVAADACAMSAQLMNYGRNQAGNEELLDLAGLVRERVRMLEGLAGDRARILVRGTDAPLRVFASPTQMEQILVNLVVNALDAITGGGDITIATGQADRMAWLRISDTGAGMTPDIQARIFDPFFTTKEPGLGTGLGLASVKAIVSQMGGQIGVESAPGQGTAFTVRLPLAAPPQAEA